MRRSDKADATLAADGVMMQPLTAARWPDLVELFGPERGASSGCWCMWPRMARSEWKALGLDGRREAFHAIVEAGPPPGLLAYEGGTAIGWVAVGPRATVVRFQGAKVSRPVEAPAAPGPDGTHAVTCFYIRSGHRKRGLMRPLAIAAVEFARANGAMAVDVCAIEADRPLVWGDGFVGIASVFRSLGFVEIVRRSPRRPLMRLTLGRHG
ncbi:MAG: GNAT family N-acetyltransferase [Methylobacteriaceae bacterium]|nr:GNAT family N-acetyltransferase [Methylobacteriaceae bacterium]